MDKPKILDILEGTPLSYELIEDLNIILYWILKDLSIESKDIKRTSPTGGEFIITIKFIGQEPIVFKAIKHGQWRSHWQLILDGFKTYDKDKFRDELLKKVIDILTQFKLKANSFDISYEFSDDPRIWNEGQRLLKELKELYKNMTSEQKQEAIIFWNEIIKKEMKHFKNSEKFSSYLTKNIEEMKKVLGYSKEEMVENIMKEIRQPSYPIPTSADESYVMLILAIGTAKRSLPNLNTLAYFDEKDEEKMVNKGLDVMNGKIDGEEYADEFLKLLKKYNGGTIPKPDESMIRAQVVARVNRNKAIIVNPNLKKIFKKEQLIKEGYEGQIGIYSKDPKSSVKVKVLKRTEGQNWDVEVLEDKDEYKKGQKINVDIDTVTFDNLDFLTEGIFDKAWVQRITNIRNLYKKFKEKGKFQTKEGNIITTIDKFTDYLADLFHTEPHIIINFIDELLSSKDRKILQAVQIHPESVLKEGWKEVDKYKASEDWNNGNPVKLTWVNNPKGVIIDKFKIAKFFHTEPDSFTFKDVLKNGYPYSSLRIYIQEGILKENVKSKIWSRNDNVYISDLKTLGIKEIKYKYNFIIPTIKQKVVIHLVDCKFKEREERENRNDRYLFYKSDDEKILVNIWFDAYTSSQLSESSRQLIYKVTGVELWPWPWSEYISEGIITRLVEKSGLRANDIKIVGIGNKNISFDNPVSGYKIQAYLIKIDKDELGEDIQNWNYGIQGKTEKISIVNG
jgi:hypothetical protein